MICPLDGQPCTGRGIIPADKRLSICSEQVMMSQSRRTTQEARRGSTSLKGFLSRRFLERR